MKKILKYILGTVFGVFVGYYLHDFATIREFMYFF